jgi:hypothetical protein
MNFPVWIRIFSFRIMVMIFFASGSFGSLRAQDTQYWFNQYGTKAALLGGLVVGSVSDLSAAYYNPGILPFVREKLMVQSSNAVKTYGILVGDAIFPEDDFLYLNAGFSPGLFAIKVLGGKPEDLHLVVSFQKSQDFEYEIQGWNISDYVSSPSPDDYIYSVNGYLRTSLFEGRGGISLASRIGNNSGLGVTQYFSYRSQNMRRELNMGLLDSDNRNLALHYVYSYSYWNLNTFLKIGFFHNFDSLSLGINLVTPGINIINQGETYINAYEFANSGPGSEDNYYILGSNVQRGLPVSLKFPFSTALGISYSCFPWRFHFTAEWFQGLTPYEVIETDSFTVQSTGESFHQQFYTSAKSLINFGFAGTYTYSNKISYYFAAYTDYSYNEGFSKNNISLSSWDIYHLNFGMSFSVLDYAISGGVGLSYGNGKTDYFFNMLPEEEIGLNPKAQLYDVTYAGLELIFSVSF